MNKTIEQIRETTANVVAKKQDVAKFNFPKILDKIRAQAELGFSKCNISITEMNEYDKSLLEHEGFRVWLIDAPQVKFDNGIYSQREPLKIWEIGW